ncbi:hypothetical protein [Sphingobacterium psychroaquaticum]|uniref:Uncharacterized protein n=1 Tax=Sphingobacterium psychroaquaticum TaxID=561061 RepID=A0A1X7JUB1_9SPHI|nr:hypothetical protein [Sphingobacterium psychroaquaticum]SMG31689.1 hypothetical protein SAMN05660862_2211 [Sphingobacterium psychroaquaticum]
MTIVKKYLEAELGQYEGIIDGGIHFKYKPTKIRLKVIELNSMNYNQSTSLSTIDDYLLNINYQDENRDLVEEVTEHIYKILHLSVIRNIYFESDTKQIFKISPYLWLGNNMFQLTNNTIYKKKKHYDRTDY